MLAGVWASLERPVHGSPPTPPLSVRPPHVVSRCALSERGLDVAVGSPHPVVVEHAWACPCDRYARGLQFVVHLALSLGDITVSLGARSRCLRFLLRLQSWRALGEAVAWGRVGDVRRCARWLGWCYVGRMGYHTNIGICGATARWCCAGVVVCKNRPIVGHCLCVGGGVRDDDGGST